MPGHWLPGAVRRPIATAPLVTLGLAASLVVASAWALVWLPGEVAVPAVLCGSAAIVAWLLYPDSPAYALLALCPFTLAFDAGTLKAVYVQDLILLPLAVAVMSGILAGVQRESRFRFRLGAILLILWVVMALWNALTYRLGSANQWLMSTEVKNTWYAYRQVWRCMLPFPLVMLYLRDPHPAGRVIDALLAVTGCMALYAVVAAPETRYVAVGPFEHGNGLAGYLVPVVPFAAARLFMSETRRSRLLAGAALLVMLRAVWLSGSRGGMVACLATFLPFALFLPRRRLAAVAATGALALAVVVFMQGNILDSPKLRRFLTLAQFDSEQTYRWRQEQWSLFFDRLRESPIMGTGSDVDRALAEMDRAQTPHNAYLAVAMRSGVPGLALVLALIATTVVLCVRGLLAPDGHPEARVFWMGFLGAIVGLCVHGFGEATIVMPQVQFLFWTLLAFAVVEASSSWSGAPLAAPGGAPWGR